MTFLCNIPIISGREWEYNKFCNPEKAVIFILIVCQPSFINKYHSFIVAIHVAINKTSYNYDRLVSLSPHIFRLRPATT